MTRPEPIPRGMLTRLSLHDWRALVHLRDHGEWPEGYSEVWRKKLRRIEAVDRIDHITDEGHAAINYIDQKTRGGNQRPWRGP